MKAENGWYYLLKGRRFRIAWCSLAYWTKRGAWTRSWYFSARDRAGYCSTINKWGYWIQICILGLNFGFIYKLQ